jgi:hypothetical protein
MKITFVGDEISIESEKLEDKLTGNGLLIITLASFLVKNGKNVVEESVSEVRIILFNSHLEEEIPDENPRR